MTPWFRLTAEARGPRETVEEGTLRTLPTTGTWELLWQIPPNAKDLKKKNFPLEITQPDLVGFTSLPLE